MAQRTRVAPLTLLTPFFVAGCLEFRGVGPEDITPERPPRTVDVTLEYTQPAGCVNPNPAECNNQVVFFGNWMRDGAQFALTRDVNNWVWRGVAKGVPVNFPPHEYEPPYAVRVWDPHLARYSAYTLKVGGELMTKIVSVSEQDEFGRVYIDENGFGHNVYY